MRECHFCLVLFGLKTVVWIIGFKWHWGGNTQKKHIRETSMSQQDF